MNVVFRVDSSIEIGTGHVMRCLTLAEYLKNYNSNINIQFICREHEGNIIEIIEKRGFKVHRLVISNDESIIYTNQYSHWLGVNWKKDALQTLEIIKSLNFSVDWLIIDHYGIDIHWEEIIRGFVCNIMVIDDLANRRHHCDLLLDQNYYKNYKERYNFLVPSNCIKLLGPEYVLLRNEFIETKRDLKPRKPRFEKLLVFFGGTDPTSETLKTLRALKNVFKHVNDLKVDVIVGKNNPHKSQVEKICSQLPNVSFYCQVDNIATFMASADFSIGAGGITIYERLYMDLPSITISIADNQTRVLRDLAKEGFLYYLGESKKVSEKMIELAILSAIQEGIRVKKYEFNSRRDFLWKQLQSCTKDK